MPCDPRGTAPIGSGPVSVPPPGACSASRGCLNRTRVQKKGGGALPCSSPRTPLGMARWPQWYVRRGETRPRPLVPSIAFSPCESGNHLFSELATARVFPERCHEFRNLSFGGLPPFPVSRRACVQMALLLECLPYTNLHTYLPSTLSPTPTPLALLTSTVYHTCPHLT